MTPEQVEELRRQAIRGDLSAINCLVVEIERLQAPPTEDVEIWLSDIEVLSPYSALSPTWAKRIDLLTTKIRALLSPLDNKAWKSVVEYAYKVGGDGSENIASITGHYNALRAKLTKERERSKELEKQVKGLLLHCELETKRANHFEQKLFRRNAVASDKRQANPEHVCGLVPGSYCDNCTPFKANTECLEPHPTTGTCNYVSGDKEKL